MYNIYDIRHINQIKMKVEIKFLPESTSIYPSLYLSILYVSATAMELVEGETERQGDEGMSVEVSQ